MTSKEVWKAKLKKCEMESDDELSITLFQAMGIIREDHARNALEELNKNNIFSWANLVSLQEAQDVIKAAGQPPNGTTIWNEILQYKRRETSVLTESTKRMKISDLEGSAPSLTFLCNFDRLSIAMYSKSKSYSKFIKLSLDLSATLYGRNTNTSLMMYRRPPVEDLLYCLQKKVLEERHLLYIYGPPGTGKSLTTFAFMCSRATESWIVSWFSFSKNGVIYSQLEGNTIRKCTVYDHPSFKEILRSVSFDKRHFVVLDGFLRELHHNFEMTSTGWLGDAILNKAANNARLIIVTSMSSMDTTSQSLTETDYGILTFKMESWTMPEYRDAIVDDDFYESVKVNLVFSDEEVKDLVQTSVVQAPAKKAEVSVEGGQAPTKSDEDSDEEGQALTEGGEVEAEEVRPLTEGNEKVQAQAGKIQPPGLTTTSLDVIQASSDPAQTGDSVNTRSQVVGQDVRLHQLERKFFYAGFSARYMFYYKIKRVVTEIKAAIEMVNSIEAVFQGDIGDRSRNVKNRLYASLRQQLPDGSRFGTDTFPLLISEYAGKALARKLGPDQVIAWAGVLKPLRNPSLFGWIFEILFFKCLESPDGASLKTRTENFEYIRWPHSKPREYDPVTFYPHDFKLYRNTWFKPVIWNQPAFDAFMMDHDPSDSMMKITFVQCTTGNTHDLRLDEIYLFMAKLSQMPGLTIEFKELNIIFVVPKSKLDTFSINNVEGKGLLQAFGHKSELSSVQIAALEVEWIDTD